MSNAVQFYITTLLVYAGVNVLAAWGLNLQFGVAGLLSFAFIVFQAAGAYTAAVLTLGPQSNNSGFQHYIAGYELPFPLPLIAAGVVGAAISVPIGIIALRKLRSDYQAVALLVISIIASSVAINEVNLFNGAAGLALVPSPLADSLNVDAITYQWIFVGYTLVICGLGYIVMHRITHSPLGRAMRAMRDNEEAAEAFGKNVVALRLIAFAIGGAFAGISGAILVEFIGAWAPSGWLYPETFVLLAAILVGGTGNSLGVIVGVLLVPIGFQEAARFLPPIGRAGLIDAIQWIVIGVLLLLFLWFRPQGILPERRRRMPKDDEHPGTSQVIEATGTQMSG